MHEGKQGKGSRHARGTGVDTRWIDARRIGLSKSKNIAKCYGTIHEPCTAGERIIGRSCWFGRWSAVRLYPPAFDSLRNYSFHDLTSDTMAGPDGGRRGRAAGDGLCANRRHPAAVRAVHGDRDDGRWRTARFVEAAHQRSDQRDLDRRAECPGRFRRCRTNSGGDSAWPSSSASSKRASRCCGWAT